MANEPRFPGLDVPVLDDERLLGEFGGQPELIVELREIFLEHVPPLLDGIKQAIDEEDGEAMTQNAHALKGACTTYGAPRLEMFCKVYEQFGEDKHFDLANQHWEKLSQECRQVVNSIKGLNIS